jgi:carbamoylphosphate synthase large subunit
MKKYLLLLGADQFLRERSYSGGKSINSDQIWTAIKDAKYKYNAYFDFCIDASPLNYEELKSEIEYYKTLGYEPKSIVPLNDWTLKVANKLNKEYGLPYLEENVVNACRNKNLMKSIFNLAKIPTPKSAPFNNKIQLQELMKEFEFPVIIKPLEFGGSGGVYLANNENECVDAYNKSREIMCKYADTFKVSKNIFLIEEFIDSDDEVSVEVLCSNDVNTVITITEKYLSPKPWFTEMGHVVPSHRYKDKNIKNLAMQSCEALGINRGIAHVEIKIKGNELFVIEVAARPGGDAIMDLIESAYNINPYQLHIASYINNKDELPEIFTPHKTAAIAFMKAPKGKITKINFPDMSKDKAIKRIGLLKNIGDRVNEPENWSDREGLIEFVWHKIPIIKEYKHINKANQLSNEIFECSEINDE